MIRSHYTKFLLTAALVSLVNPATWAQQAAVEGSRAYVIQPGESILRIYAGRAGLLSGMGHNHVIHTREIKGRITLGNEPRGSSARFNIPVDELIVDDIDERRRAGEGYTSEPSESDKQGTRRNMLGERLLNADEFPLIQVSAETGSAGQTDRMFFIRLEFKGEQYTFELPASVVQSGDRLTVDSTFTLDHADLGLTPFSVMGGMLKVANGIRFELHIMAVKESEMEADR